MHLTSYFKSRSWMIFFKSQGTMALQTFSKPKTRVKPNQSFSNPITHRQKLRSWDPNLDPCSIIYVREGKSSQQRVIVCLFILFLYIILFLWFFHSLAVNYFKLPASPLAKFSQKYPKKKIQKTQQSSIIRSEREKDLET